MKIMYIDCTAGVCADMILNAMTDMGAEADPRVFEYDEKLRYAEYDHLLAEAHHHNNGEGIHGDEHHHKTEQGCREAHHHDGGHCHGAEDKHCHGAEHGNEDGYHHEHEVAAEHSHEHRSYSDVKAIIDNSPLTASAKVQAHRVYAAIAKAEAKVHGTTIEGVHFHEVGRHEAVMNVITLATLLESIGADRIICSPIHDGCGFIDCSHGRIPVPVPAVMAMREDCDYIFNTEHIETEMVTPSGLAMLIGMGAICGERPQGSVILKGVGFGKRDTGLGGMEIYLIEQ